MCSPHAKSRCSTQDLRGAHPLRSVLAARNHARPSLSCHRFARNWRCPVKGEHLHLWCMREASGMYLVLHCRPRNHEHAKIVCCVTFLGLVLRLRLTPCPLLSLLGKGASSWRRGRRFAKLRVHGSVQRLPSSGVVPSLLRHPTSPFCQ